MLVLIKHDMEVVLEGTTLHLIVNFGVIMRRLIGATAIPSETQFAKKQ